LKKWQHSRRLRAQAEHPPILRALLSLLLALFAILSFSCEERIKPPITWSIDGNIPAQESWDAKIVFTDSGRVGGILHAGHIVMYPDRNLTMLDSNISVDFYDDQQHHTSTLTARRGRVDDVTHDFEAHDHVLVVSDSGTTLMTEDLYWTNATRKIHTQAFVDISSPKEHLQGHGFESDQDLKHYTIFEVAGQAKTDE
jgi:LPS export ABC transporter protein LptC